MANTSGWIKRGLLRVSGLLVALVALAGVALLYFGIPQNAAGMATKGICSAAFVAGRPWQKMMAEDVLPARLRCCRSGVVYWMWLRPVSLRRGFHPALRCTAGRWPKRSTAC